MRIAVFVSYFPALSITFILNQLTGLIDRGHTVDIYADRPGTDKKVHPDVVRYSLLQRTHYHGIPSGRLARAATGVGRLVANVWRRPVTVARALNTFRHGVTASSLALLYAATSMRTRRDYDVIHCHFGPTGLLALGLRDIGLLSGKIVTTFHGYDVNRYPLRFGRDVYRPLFARGDLFTANTTFTAGRASALGCPRERITILPVGLNMAKFAFAERKREADGRVGLLSVARLVKQKGLEYSIRAVARIVREHPHVHYEIVGDGERRPHLERLVRELTMQEHVSLVGWMAEDEVLRAYAQNHVFILPSVTAHEGDQEGQGLVLQEAQATGMPVLTTLHGGIPDGVVDGLSGFLVPEGDVDALADRLEYLITHPQKWAEMGRAGRTFVEARYDINALNDRLVELFEGVCSEGA